MERIRRKNLVVLMKIRVNTYDDKNHEIHKIVQFKCSHSNSCYYFFKFSK
jgi:hypothetical protein